MVEKAKARSPETRSIVDRLAGKRVFLTGVTGFLGQVILERLLADFPETRIVLLVRSQTGASSVERVHYLTRKPSFDALRKKLGSDDALLRLLDERVEVVDGDFSRGQPDLPGGIDVTIHSAATVAFDPPIGPKLAEWGIRCVPGFDAKNLASSAMPA